MEEYSKNILFIPFHSLLPNEALIILYLSLLFPFILVLLLSIILL